MNTLTKLPLLERKYPFTLNFSQDTTIEEFVSWYRKNNSVIEKQMLKKGAVLVRGVSISDLKDFEQVINSTSERFINYIDGNSPRTKLSSSVYTSTEYDKNSFITLHNELSYTNRWPKRQFFCCICPAELGGETPIADCRQILKRMPAGLVEEIEKKKVRYIRNLHSGKGFGPSWQETFETDDKHLVERYCHDGDIEFTWKDDGGIRLVQNREGIISHPLTQEKVWFNQIDQFHPIHLKKEVYETLLMLFEDNEENLPMNATFGDGSKISDEVILTIRKVVDEVAVCFEWQKGDLLIVDNVLTAHGRKPFEGERKVLVSMA